MKIALFDDFRVSIVEGGDRLRDVSDAIPERTADWPWPWVPRLIARFPELRAGLEKAATQVEPKPIQNHQLLSPIPWPGQIVAAAANYNEHAREMAARPGSTLGEGLQGEIFLKAPASIVGHGATVTLPNMPGREIHHEAELGVIIGARMFQVADAHALDYVFGYTCLMDLTVRGRGDRSRRKSYAGFTPLGPWLVTADEIADPQAVGVRLWCNDELRQDGTTADMVYSVAELLAYASAVMPLYPGDVLATGTPSGVGPIQAGDHVVMELGGIGRLAVDIAAAPLGAPLAEPGLGNPKNA